MTVTETQALEVQRDELSEPFILPTPDKDTLRSKPAKKAVEAILAKLHTFFTPDTNPVDTNEFFSRLSHVIEEKLLRQVGATQDNKGLENKRNPVERTEDKKEHTKKMQAEIDTILPTQDEIDAMPDKIYTPEAITRLTLSALRAIFLRVRTDKPQTTIDPFEIAN